MSNTSETSQENFSILKFDVDQVNSLFQNSQLSFLKMLTCILVIYIKVVR